MTVQIQSPEKLNLSRKSETSNVQIAGAVAGVIGGVLGGLAHESPVAALAGAGIGGLMGYAVGGIYTEIGLGEKSSNARILEYFISCGMGAATGLIVSDIVGTVANAVVPSVAHNNDESPIPGL